MTKKSPSIFSIAAALAALSTFPTEADAAIESTNVSSAVATVAQELATGPKPNAFYTAGEELLGMIVTRQSDGSVIAAHSSHVSHASHASHHSHYSSR